MLLALKGSSYLCDCFILDIGSFSTFKPPVYERLHSLVDSSIDKCAKVVVCAKIHTS